MKWFQRNQAKLGKMIRTRWVETLEGDEVRCGFVAQEFAKGDPRDDLFASTPTSSLARLLVSCAATSRKRMWTLMTMAVSCAFLYAAVAQDLYIDPESGAGRVGHLWKALHGTRDAPALWQKTLTNVMHKLGFRENVLQPGFFIHQQEVHVVKHVVDFLCAGPVEDLKWFKKALSENFNISGQCIGDYDEKNKTRVRTLKFLGRKISKVANGYDWEADPKHVAWS